MLNTVALPIPLGDGYHTKAQNTDVCNFRGTNPLTLGIKDHKVMCAHGTHAHTDAELE